MVAFVTGVPFFTDTTCPDTVRVCALATMEKIRENREEVNLYEMMFHQGFFIPVSVKG